MKGFSEKSRSGVNRVVFFFFILGKGQQGQQRGGQEKG